MHPKQLLDRYHIEPKKSLGQNFLHDEGLLGRIVAAADLSPDDEVLEVGPGLGALTRVLARAARRVVAVELDGRLLPVLESELGGLSNVELVHADVLQLDPADWFTAPYVVVANVPYLSRIHILKTIGVALLLALLAVSGCRATEGVVTPAVPYTILDGETSVLVDGQHETVGDVLAAAGVTLGEADSVSASAFCPAGGSPVAAKSRKTTSTGSSGPWPQGWRSCSSLPSLSGRGAVNRSRLAAGSARACLLYTSRCV